MVRQIGYSPKEFAQIMIEKEGGFEKAKKLFNKSEIKPSNYHPEEVKINSAGEKYSKILEDQINYACQNRICLKNRREIM